MTKRKLIYLKDLTIALTIKELKSRYKSATLGFLWIFINPLLQMLAISIIFSFVLKTKVENYPLFVFSGLLPWTFFSLSLQSGTSSLTANRDLIKKINFPRELLPISSVLANLFIFLISIFILVIFTFVTSGWSFKLFFLMPLIFLQTMLVSGIVLILSSLDIYYRDISFILQAALPVWLCITPIIYPIKFIPLEYLFLYNLNPMVGIITSYQTIFLNEGQQFQHALIIAIFETMVLLSIGIILFKKRSQYFADWV